MRRKMNKCLEKLGRSVYEIKSVVVIIIIIMKNIFFATVSIKSKNVQKLIFQREDFPWGGRGI